MEPPAAPQEMPDQTRAATTGATSAAATGATNAVTGERAPGRVPEGRPTSGARTSLSRIMTTLDTNLLGTVHGGVVMKLVDDVAGAVAQRHSGGPAVTASMDEMAFLEPVRVGDLVHARAQVNWTGRTSMEVGVRVLAEPWNEVAPPVRVATAYLVFVAVDAAGSPRAVPPVLPETEEDRRRFAEAEIRRTHRLARRAAILASRAEPEDLDPPDGEGRPGDGG